MLPVHSYSELKKFTHLVGNYGTAWQNQRKEFSMFGPTLPAFITPNVLQVLQQNYNINLISTSDEDIKAILGLDSL